MSPLFLFGAGASYGSGPCHPTQPPLGRDLFDALRSAGGLASRLDSELASKFERDFEIGMDYLREVRSDLVTEFILDMARFFAPFTPVRGNCYLKLMNVLGNTRSKSVMVTLNYECLLEVAICLSGARVAYTWPATSRRNVSVLKIHGSCNFALESWGGSITGATFLLPKTGNGSLVDAPIAPLSTTKDILNYCDRNDSVAPAMALYSPTKQLLFGPTEVRMYQRMWKKAVETASSIFLVGVRVHPVDKHIWEPIRDSIAPLHYVGYEPDEFKSWANSNGRGDTNILAKSFDEAIPKIARQIN